MGVWRSVAILLSALLAASACAGATAPPSAGSAKASPSAASELAKIRARGTLIVGIRMEAPNPPNRTMGDPAHGQKHDFELAVATLVARALIGPSAKVELKVLGGDRIALLSQGADIAMVVDAPASRDRALLSSPYAANSVVLAVKEGSAIARPEDVAGKNVALAQDELGARDLATAFFQQKGTTTTLDNYQGVFGATAALDDGKAVALVGDGIGVAILAADRKLKVLTAVASRPYVIAVRQGATDLAQAVSGALQVALQNGAIKDAAAKAGFPYQAP